MCQMVGHEMKSLPQRTSKKLVDGTAHLTEPQPEGLLKPRIPPLGAISLSAQFGVERVCDVIDIAGGEPGVVQAEADRTFGELMRVVEFGLLAVLDAIEPFLLDGGDERAVDEQRGGRLVIHRVDSKDVHRPTRPAVPLCKHSLHCRKLRRSPHGMAAPALLLANSWHLNQERAGTNNDRGDFRKSGQAGTSGLANQGADGKPAIDRPSAVICKQLDRLVEAAHRVFTDAFEREIAFDEIGEGA